MKVLIWSVPSSFVWFTSRYSRVSPSSLLRNGDVTEGSGHVRERREVETRATPVTLGFPSFTRVSPRPFRLLSLSSPFVGSWVVHSSPPSLLPSSLCDRSCLVPFVTQHSRSHHRLGSSWNGVSWDRV